MASPRKPKSKSIRAKKVTTPSEDILNLDDIVWRGGADQKADTDEGLSLIEAELQRQISGQTEASTDQDDQIRRIIAEEVGDWLQANMARILKETLAEVKKRPKKKAKSTSKKSPAKKTKKSTSAFKPRVKTKSAAVAKSPRAAKKKKSARR